MKIICTMICLKWWRKNKIQNFILVFFITFAFYQCKDKYAEENIKLQEVLTHLKEIPSANIYIVLPEAGCSGCISTAEDFMYQNLEKNKNIKFILTGITSKKLFKQRFGKWLENKNILSDYQNICAIKNIHTIYPKIYYLENKKVINVEEASPTNKNAWENVNKYIKQ